MDIDTIYLFVKNIQMKFELFVFFCIIHFSVMSSLYRLLLHHSSQVHQSLIWCAIGRIKNVHTNHKYTIESCGSGILLCTTDDVSKWLDTHRLFLGHGGTEILDKSHLPSPYTGIIAACARAFQGTLKSTTNVFIDSAIRVMWNPTTALLAYATKDCNIMLRDSMGKRVHTLLTYAKRWSPKFVWNPQGTILGITTCGENKFTLWNVQTKTIQNVIVVCSQIAQIVWNPNGTMVALNIARSYEDTYVNIYRLDGSRVANITPCHEYHEVFYCMAWSPDGKYLAIGTNHGSAQIVHVQESGVVETHAELLRVFDPLCKISWNWDGTLLACKHATSDQTHIWTKNGILLHTFQHAECDSYYARSWNPRQNIFVYGSGTDAILTHFTLDGKLIKKTELSHSSRISRLAWSHDGQLLAAALDNYTIVIWNIDGTLRAMLKGHTHNIRSISWSPIMPYLVSTSVDNTLRIWH